MDRQRFFWLCVCGFLLWICLNKKIIDCFGVQRKASQLAHRPSPKEIEAEGSGEEGMDVDLDNFMTLDSVGDVDGNVKDNLLLLRH